VPWAKKVEAESGGRIKVDVSPAMQLGGAPPQLFDQARDGVVDLVWTLPGYTANRFPISEVFELPFIASKRAMANSKALQEFSTKHLAKEFSEIHPICFWAHDGGLIHASRPVSKLEDMKGLKLRFPTRLAGEGLRALGATAIGMPVPQVPEAIAQRVIDGAVVPWEIVPSIRLQELVKNHTAFPGTPTFYTSTFVLAMNKARYANLAPDLKKVIDANSGQVATAMVATMFDTTAPKVEAIAKKRGNKVHTLAREEVARWKTACEPVTKAWLKAMNEKGIKGENLIADASALIKKYDAA
jgi:TRAP-type C4-dicarboxylate transport system substrate-binding protein